MPAAGSSSSSSLGGSERRARSRAGVVEPYGSIRPAVRFEDRRVRRLEQRARLLRRQHARRPCHAAPRSTSARPRAVRTGERHDVRSRAAERAKQTDILERARDAASADDTRADGRLISFAVDAHVAFGRGVDPGDDVEGGGLAGAVRPMISRRGSGPDREVDVATPPSGHRSEPGQPDHLEPYAGGRALAAGARPSAPKERGAQLRVPDPCGRNDHRHDDEQRVEHHSLLVEAAQQPGAHRQDRRRDRRARERAQAAEHDDRDDLDRLHEHEAVGVERMPLGVREQPPASPAKRRAHGEGVDLHARGRYAHRFGSDLVFASATASGLPVAVTMRAITAAPRRPVAPEEPSERRSAPPGGLSPVAARAADRVDVEDQRCE